MLNAQLRTALEDNLGAIREARPVGGGDINAAARLETERGLFFVKWNLHSEPRLFEAEARGLELLALAQALRVPQVIARIDQPPALVLEWVEAGSNKSAAASPSSTARSAHSMASITTTTSARIHSTIRRAIRGGSSFAIDGWANRPRWRKHTAISRPIGPGGSIG